MKLVSYTAFGGDARASRYGVVVNDHVYDLTTAKVPTLRAALSIEGLNGIAARAAAVGIRRVSRIRVTERAGKR